MDNLDFNPHDAGLLDFASAFGPNDPRSHTYPPFSHPPQHDGWPPLTLDAADKDDKMYYHSSQHQTMPPASSSSSHHQQHQQHQQQPPPPPPPPQSSDYSRPSSNQSDHSGHFYPSGLELDYTGLFPSNWPFQSPSTAQQHQHPHPHFHADPLAHHAQALQHQLHLHENDHIHLNTYINPAFGGAQLQSSPVDLMPTTAADTGYVGTTGIDATPFMTMAGPMDSMNSLIFPLSDHPNDAMFPIALNNAALQQHALNQQAADGAHTSGPCGSPSNTIYEVQSCSDNEWSMINVNTNRHSLDSAGTVSNPSQNLHIRTSSESSFSDDPNSAELSGSYEEIPPWPLHSPHDFHGNDYLEAHYMQQQPHGLPMPHPQAGPSSSAALAVSTSAASTHAYRSAGSSGSSSTSPTSSGPTSPPLRRRKSPLDGKTTKAVIKKASHSPRKEAGAEKKVGRRRGPLRPEQRQQAHEIRKLRACLRCKFLKKTCDKGEPCGGCRPSHARLWQVPCTRMDIKDISYFMKDWRADYERHVSLGFSIGNIKGFSSLERTLYITHGYGHYLPISAREVFVRDEQCFEMNWVESIHETPLAFDVNTAKLTAGVEGVSTSLLSEYLDRHLDHGFEHFIDEHFEGTAFLTEILKTAYRYYQKEKNPAVRKALKLLIAYNLTLHITMVEGLSEEEQFAGRIEDEASRYSGKTLAPVMINFQVKCAMAEMWRELQKDILEELSTLYSSVYSGDKLKNWPTIFMLAAILLAMWELMQFDCHYRIPDEKEVNKFCDEMETTPVGVIVGLFQAISTKLPGLQEWDTRKHHHLLGSNPAVCEALTEVRDHVNKYETYLKERQNAKFDREDFDSLSNKFLSKLVIRAT